MSEASIVVGAADHTSGGSLIRHDGLSDLIVQLVDTDEFIDGAVLATTDGLPVAHKVSATATAARLCAMASALLGLCDAVTEECRIGPAQETIVEGAHGRLLALSVDTGATKLVLLIVGKPEAPLGRILWAARNAARMISSLA